jgi:hypothetical protein
MKTRNLQRNNTARSTQHATRSAKDRPSSTKAKQDRRDRQERQERCDNQNYCSTAVLYIEMNIGHGIASNKQRRLSSRSWRKTKLKWKTSKTRMKGRAIKYATSWSWWCALRNSYEILKNPSFSVIHSLSSSHSSHSSQCNTIKHDVHHEKQSWNEKRQIRKTWKAARVTTQQADGDVEGRSTKRDIETSHYRDIEESVHGHHRKALALKKPKWNANLRFSLVKLSNIEIL